MKLFCQCGMAWMLAANFLVCTYYDFEGRSSKEPGGFSGFVGTCISIGIVAALYVGSGALSELF